MGLWLGRCLGASDCLTTLQGSRVGTGPHRQSAASRASLTLPIGLYLFGFMHYVSHVWLVHAISSSNALQILSPISVVPHDPPRSFVRCPASNTRSTAFSINAAASG